MCASPSCINTTARSALAVGSTTQKHSNVDLKVQKLQIHYYFEVEEMLRSLTNSEPVHSCRMNKLMSDSTLGLKKMGMFNLIGVGSQLRWLILKEKKKKKERQA